MMNPPFYEPPQRTFPDEGFRWDGLRKAPLWTGSLGLTSILKLLKRAYRCEKIRPEEVTWQRFDTADMRLQKAGYLLLLERAFLVLVPFDHFPFGAVASAEVSPQLKSVPAGALLGTTLGARLAELCGRRTALSIVPLEASFTPINLRNEDEKLVLRLCLAEVYSLTREGQRSYHGSVIWGETIRGYKSDLKRAMGCVTAESSKDKGDTFFSLVSETGYDTGPPLQIGLSEGLTLPQLLDAHLLQARKNERGMVDDIDAVFFEDYLESIAAVRLSLLVFGKEAFTVKVLRGVEQKLSEMDMAVRALVDLDQLSAFKPEALDGCPPVFQTGIQGVFEWVRRQRNATQASLADALSETRHQRCARELSRRFSQRGTNAKPISDRDVAKALSKQLVDLEHYLATISARSDEEELAELEGACQRFQFAASFWPELQSLGRTSFFSDLSRFLGVLAQLRQRVLFQVALLTVVEEAERTAPDIDLAAGAIITKMYQEEQQLRQQLMDLRQTLETMQFRALIEKKATDL